MEERYIVCDLESNGLLDSVSMIWCLCAIDHNGKRYEAVGHDKIRDLLDTIKTFPVSVWHNGVGYDRAVIKRILGVELDNITDTFILSTIVNPDIPGGHSLAAWGERLGDSKLEHEDWSVFSEEMLERCKQDVVLGRKLYLHLLKEMDGWDWEQAVKLEHCVSKLHSKQIENGVKFSIDKAGSLCYSLKELILSVTTTILPSLPFITVKGTTVEKVFKKDGWYNSYVEAYWGLDVDKVGGSYSKISFAKVNLDSQQQVKDYFLSLGWKPTEFTDKGSPQLTEDSFSSLPEGTPAARLAERRIASHRLSQVEGLMRHVRPDGRIPADANPCGAATGRYQHRIVANLPRVTSPYGPEMRDLFIVDDGNVMVGSDLSQIEARVMGHYLYPYDQGAFIKELLEGDIHQSLADALKITRDLSKTVRYASMYGCSGTKLAKILDVSKKDGCRLQEAFWNSNKPLMRLRDDITRSYKRKGFIKGLDGRKLMIRSEHALLNSLLQAAATVVFKTGMCFIEKEASRKHVDYKQLIAYHDEVQLETSENNAGTLGKIVLDSWERAGLYWKLEVPIVGEVKVGKSWRDTH